jgi:hypothetical protein
MQANFECTNRLFFSAFFQTSSTFFSQEASATTEIEFNGLLKRFVVRQAKAAKRQQVSRPTANTFSPAPVVAASPLAGVGIGSDAGLLFIYF